MKTKSGNSRKWKVAILLGIVSVVVALILTSGPSAAEQEWERYRAELKAQGEELDWEAFIPPEIPDELNFFEAPGMKEWFSRMTWETNGSVAIFRLPPAWGSGPAISLKDLQAMPALTSISSVEMNRGERTLQELREWFATLQTEYQMLIKACARPDARMNADYRRLVGRDSVHFSNVRNVAFALIARARLGLLDESAEDAMQSLSLLGGLAGAVSDKSIFMGTFFQASLMDDYVEVVLEGLKRGLFSTGDLEVIEMAVSDVDFLNGWGIALRSFRAEGLGLMALPDEKMIELSGWQRSSISQIQAVGVRNFDWNAEWSHLWLRSKVRSPSWIAMNKTVLVKRQQALIDQVDLADGRLSVKGFEAWSAGITAEINSPDFDAYLAAWMMPNFSRVLIKLTCVQTRIDQLYVACGLERYRLAVGGFPATLDELIPNYLERIPNDLFSDGDLRYRRTENGGYKIWSVGWDETDDGGQASLNVERESQYSDQKGDWVWEFHSR